MFEDWQESGARPPAKPRRRGRRFLKVLVVLLLLLAATGASAVGYYRWCKGSSGAQRPFELTIPKGTSGTGVVSILHSRDVIRCGLVSRMIVRSRNESFEAGRYRLTTNMKLDDALDALARGPLGPPTVRVTIPEGWRLEQIAARVADDLHVPASEFKAAATSGRYSLSPYLPAGTNTLEGFLFPNTYRFPVNNDSADSVIRKLLAEFGTEVRGLPWSNATQLHVTPYQVVTIASMIEREARVDRDRPKIAAVIYNRLRVGMALGIDATLQYIDPDPSNGLTASDLLIDSPYNTRLHTGLPPTPIASPGLASLRAALEPAHVDYLYYVLCGADGHHAFTASYQHFLELKSRCLG